MRPTFDAFVIFTKIEIYSVSFVWLRLGTAS